MVGSRGMGVFSKWKGGYRGESWNYKNIHYRNSWGNQRENGRLFVTTSFLTFTMLF